MTKRREFIQAGLLLSATPLTGMAGIFHVSATNAIAVNSTQPRIKPAHFVFDERFEESSAVAAFASETGTLIHAISDDLTQLWYRHLGPDWKIKAVAVAGITNEDALFYLERLAWTYRMRVVFRARHNIPVNGVITHEVVGAQSLIRRLAETETDPSQWAQTLGNCLTHCETDTDTQENLHLSLSSGTDLERDIPLVSWVLAGPGRAA